MKKSADSHEKFIRQTYRLAREARSNGDHPFSALLVVDGEVILEGLNTVNTCGDSTRHAEMEILRLAARQTPLIDFSAVTLYASTEPCAMCCGAIYWSGIRKLVYGCPTESLGEIAGGSFVVPSRELLSRGKRSVDIIGPVLPEEGVEVHRGFW